MRCAALILYGITAVCAGIMIANFGWWGVGFSIVLVACGTALAEYGCGRD